MFILNITTEELHSYIQLYIIINGHYKEGLPLCALKKQNL